VILFDLNVTMIRANHVRLWIFRLIPSLAILGLLVLAEALLRWHDPTLRSSLAEPITIGRTEWLRVNRGFLERYFPLGIPILPELKPTVFRASKQPGTFRVLCLGESSMFGTPYQVSATIPAMVRRKLRRMYPDRDIEVISLAASAINSHVIRDLAERSIGWEPDVVLIYTGHNEFYGPEGLGAGWLERWFPWTIRWKFGLQDFAVFAALRRALTPAPSLQEEPNLMRQVSKGTTVHPRSEDESRVYREFETNLDAVLDLYRGEGIPCIVSDVTSNLEFPPFLADPIADDIPPRTAIDSLIFRAPRDAASQMARAWIASYPENAEAEYRAGMMFAGLGEFAEARKWLSAARDHDLLRFRAPETINAIIRRCSERNSAWFISADSAIASLTHPRLPGRIYFWEHLHLTYMGYAEIAGEFVRAMIERDILPATSNDVGPNTLEGLAISWLDLAYADLSMATLTSRWPFTSYPVSSVVMGTADSVMASISREVYLKRLGWEEASYRLAARSLELGRAETALTLYSSLAEDFQGNYYAHYMAAGTLRNLGRVAEATEAYERSLAWNPEYAPASVELALLLVNLGRLDEAERHFKTASVSLHASPHSMMSATVAYGRAGIAANRGELQRALAFCDSALRLAPSYAPAIELRQRLRVALK
jgi:tetratricopeptide (TPR) repeat protein